METLEEKALKIRKLTGFGLMDCRIALRISGGHVKEAITYLEQKLKYCW